MFKKMNNIEKVAFIATMLFVVFITTCTNIPTVIRDRIESFNKKETVLYVFDNEDLNERMNVNIVMPSSMAKDINYCRLWPANEPLVGGQYWEWSTDYNQWIGCF